MKLSPYGIREWGASGIIALFLLAGTVIVAIYHHFIIGLILSILVVAMWLGLAAFFRSPKRRIPSDPDGIVSPADGIILDVSVVDGQNFGFLPNVDVIRIGIFLSIFDVHLNRVPADMTITGKLYKPGKYLDARNPKAAKENESMLVYGNATIGKTVIPLAVRQISGAVARRIVCTVVPGARLQKGDIFGMIKFGSRTELFIPVRRGLVLKKTVGDRVSAGTSIVAEIKNISNWQTME